MIKIAGRFIELSTFDSFFTKKYELELSRDFYLMGHWSPIISFNVHPALLENSLGSMPVLPNPTVTGPVISEQFISAGKRKDLFWVS